MNLRSNKVAPLELQKSVTMRKQVEDDIRLADSAKAHEYMLQNMFYQRDEHGDLVPYPLDIELDEFKRYGLGLFLYFKFLAWVIVAFLIMSICASVICYFNSVGDGLAQWKSLNTLQKLSIGNQAKLASGGSTYTTTDIETFQSDQQGELQIVSWLDFSYSIVFALFWILFSYWSGREVDFSRINDKVPASFAITIKGLQENEKDPRELKNFLESLGYSIREVRLAKNYSNTLFLHKYESELQVKIKCEDIKQTQPGFDPKKKEILLEKLKEVQMEREKVMREKIGRKLSHNEYPTLLAFVLFQRMTDKTKFIQDYKSQTQFNFFQICCGKKPNEKYLYKGEILKITPSVDNPSNINWENLEVTSSNRFLRQLLVGFAVFLLMIITFFIVFAVNIVSKYSPEDCPNKEYTYANTQIWISQASTDSEKIQIQQCFCMNQDLTTLYTNYLSYCNDIIYEYTAVQGLQIASAFVILIVNGLLQWLIKNIIVFERYSSVSKALSGTFTKLLIALFVNTALIALILKANIYGFELAYYLSSPIPPIQSAQKDQVYPDDFNRDWYAVIGAAMVNTWIINIFTPYFVDFVLHPIKNWFRRRSAKSAQIQRDLNNLSVGPDFSLDLYYANLLNTIFVTLFYSAPIPLMLPFGLLALVMHFLVQKFLLLRYYRKPPAYDEALHEATMKIIPIALIFHILIAIWVYGHPLIFPPSVSSLSTDGSYIYIDQDSVWLRIKNTPQLAILGVLFVVILLLKYVFIDPLKYLFGLCCGSETEFDETSKDIKYDDIYEELSLIQLATYEIRDNQKYKDLIASMDQDQGTLRQENMEESQLLKKV